MKKSFTLPGMTREASFMPETFNIERNTVDLVWSTGTRVKRGGFWEEPFYEELSMERKHVRLDRLNNGASVLNNHDSQDLRSIIGVVEKAKIEDGKGLATVRLSSREDVKGIAEDIKNGVIRNISIGYRVHSFEETPEKSEGLPVFRATDWEPMEISFVTIPADPGAQVRNAGQKYDCNLILRGEDGMSDKNVPVVQATESKVDVEAIRKEAMAAERCRVSEISLACRNLGLDESFSGKLISDGSSIEAARTAIIEARSVKDKENHTSSPNIQVTSSEAQNRSEGMFEALCHRANPKEKLTEKGRMFRSLSLSDMARVSLEAQGIKTIQMSKDEIVRKTFDLRIRGVGHTSSDFTLLLENLATKSLQSAYQAAPKVFAPIVREVTVPDFKQVSRVALGDAPELELLPEGADIKAGLMGEAAEKYSIATYAKMIRFSRQMLVNDDLDALTRVPEMFGRRAAEKESDLVWAVIMANAALSDTVALFHATHANLNSGGAAAIALASVGAARAAMRKQVGVNGSRITLNPTWLFVPPELETVAQQFVSANIVPEAFTTNNPFAGKLQVAVEPRLSDSALTGYDVNAWLLTADTSQVDILELARLQGQEGPVIESDEMFDYEGMKIKCRLDIGAKAIDYRGLNKNDGA